MNTDQRKALEKIVQKEISKKRTNLSDSEDRKIGEVLHSLVKENKPKVLKLKVKKELLSAMISKIGEEIEELGFELDYSGELSPTLPPKGREAISKEFEVQRKKLDDVETKLTAKVWGVETDFESLLKAIEKELAKF